LSPKERARADDMAARLVDELQLVDEKARGLAAHLVAVHGAASFDELLDPDIFDDLDVLAPYGLLPVPLKKLKKRQRAWASGGSEREVAALKRELTSQRIEQETLLAAEIATAMKLREAYESRVAHLEHSARSRSRPASPAPLDSRGAADVGRIGSPRDGPGRPIWKPLGL